MSMINNRLLIINSESEARGSECRAELLLVRIGWQLADYPYQKRPAVSYL